MQKTFTRQTSNFRVAPVPAGQCRCILPWWHRLAELLSVITQLRRKAAPTTKINVGCNPISWHCQAAQTGAGHGMLKSECVTRQICQADLNACSCRLLSRLDGAAARTKAEACEVEAVPCWCCIVLQACRQAASSTALCTDARGCCLKMLSVEWQDTAPPGMQVVPLQQQVLRCASARKHKLIASPAIVSSWVGKPWGWQRKEDLHPVLLDTLTKALQL